MEFNIKSKVEDYLSQADWRVAENSNTRYSFAGLQGHIANEGLSAWALDTIYTGEISRAHADGLYHIHDISQDRKSVV